MTSAEEYYEETFPEDYKTFGDKDIRQAALFSFDTTMKLMELYHSDQLVKMLKSNVNKYTKENVDEHLEKDGDK